MVRTLSNVCIFLILLLSFFAQANAADRQDMAGAADHPLLPRVAGSTIVGYSKASYENHNFLNGYEDKEPLYVSKEGKLTRIVYVLTKEQTSLLALRNYQEAFAQLGKVTELFSCKGSACERKIAPNYLQEENVMVKSEYRALDQVYRYAHQTQAPIYWYATVESETASYHVAVFSSQIKKATTTVTKDGFAIGDSFVHIDIVEDSSFKSDLVVVKATEIQSAIKAKGHIALYGLFFDTGKDQLIDKSKPTLAEIASAIRSDGTLKLYVVGHTDNVGSLESNQDLSLRRAKSVIQSLVSEHNIEASRLVPIGVGLAAPVASNDTEEGRAQNRRVELVKR